MYISDNILAPLVYNVKKWRCDVKKLMLIFGFGLILILSACGGSEPEGPTLQEQFQDAAAKVTVFDASLRDNVTLPSSVDGFSITWSSANPAVFNIDGTVVRPTFSQTDASVVVTGIFEKDGQQFTKTFEALVLKVGEAELRAQILAVINALPFVNQTVSERVVFPGTVDGVVLTYNSSLPSSLTNDGVVFKNLASVGNESISLTVTGTLEGFSTSTEVNVVVASFPVLSIVEENDIRFIPIDGEFSVSPGEMTIYTMNNSMPYVDLTDFMSTISGAIVWSDLDITTTDTTYTIRLFSPADPEDPLSEDFTYELSFDFEQHTATVNYYSFFGAILASTATDFGRGLDFIDYESNVDEIQPVVFDLSSYRMELFLHEDKFLVPFHLANLFLSGSVYDVYYNGDRIFGQDAYEFNASRERFNRSSLNTENMPYDLKEMSYHYMAFMMNYFFGLQSDFGIDNFYDVLAKHQVRWFSDRDTTHYRVIADIVLELDDLHTSHSMNGPYINTPFYSLAITDLGTRSQRLYNTLFYELDGTRFCGDDGVEYFDNDTAAIIHIGGFNDASTQLMKDVMAEIDAKGTVQKIVVNMACNTGGIIGTAWQILGYLTDEPMEYYSQNAGDGLQAKSTFTSENTTEGDYEWFVLTSPITYSAANLFASMAKDMGLATIIGQQSSGGAASVKIMIMPNGTVIRISSPNILSNSNYESIEFGIPVDIEIPLNIMGNDDLNIDALINAIR
jgi:carboxyl-terminal processing protease